MDVDYGKILSFMLEAGKRLVARAGKIADIGITKTDLTEEDLVIERGFKKIISDFGPNHTLFAEEENDQFYESENIWAVDPISGTAGFIKGLPHYYSIVISHMVNRQPVFAAVYDPAWDEMYTAYAGKGAFLNGKPIKVSQKRDEVILRPSSQWKKPEIIERAEELFKNFKVINNRYSIALNYCAVARGLQDGIASFTKDAFPEFAGGLIIREAGGRFTNIQGEEILNPTDRIFVGGNTAVYSDLLSLVRQAVNDYL